MSAIILSIAVLLVILVDMMKNRFGFFLILSLVLFLFPLSAEAKEKISLYYDDVYSFSEAYPDCSIKEIRTQKVTSYQVRACKVMDEYDTDVLISYGEDDTTVLAVGCGKAVVTLVDNTGASNEVDVYVKAAPLTVMYLSGQSNMQGINPKIKQRSGDSIACKEGTVYDTAYELGGDFPFVRGDVENIVPGNLGGLIQLAPNGEELPVPTDVLTTAGTGKTGPDSGLGYEWNRLTGDKVYVVNAALGATYIADWQPGKPCFDSMRKIFETADRTVEAEEDAGHYRLKKNLFFWMQGEEDTKTSMAAYRKDFLHMISKIRSVVDVDKIGIITTRAYAGSDKGSLVMSGPRVAFYGLANRKSASDKDIYIVSSAHELWTSDEAVKAYFSLGYKSGRLEYPLRPKASMKNKLPTKLSQVLGKDGHFWQIGHNENGITAARGMYDVLNDGKAVSASWIDEEGSEIKKVTLKEGEETTLITRVTDSSESKDVTCKLEGVKGKYSIRDGILFASKKGKGYIVAYKKNGKVLSRIPVTIEKNKKIKHKKTKSKKK